MPRNHLIEKDIQVFLTDYKWETTLKNRVDFNNATTPDKFLPMILSELIHNPNPLKKLKDSLNKLEKVNYPFKEEQVIPMMVRGGVLEKSEKETLIYFFNYMKTKTNVSLKKYSNEISDKLFQIYNPDLIDYLENEGVSIKFNNIKYLIGQSGNDSVDFFEHLPLLGGMASGIMGASGFNQEVQNQNEQTQYIDNYIKKANLNKTQLNELLKEICCPQNKIEEYIQKHNLPVNPINMMSYYQNTNPKPREWFGVRQIRLINAIEEKLDISYLEPETPKNKMKF